MSASKPNRALLMLVVAALILLPFGGGILLAAAPTYTLDNGTVRQTWGVGGTGGPAIANDAGTLQVLAPDGAIGQLLVATPTTGAAAATKTYVDTHVTGGAPSGTGLPYIVGSAYAANAVTTTTDLQLGTLSGTSLPATVVGLQGRTLSSSAPAVGNQYTWSGSNWTPSGVSLGGGSNFVNGVLPVINGGTGLSAGGTNGYVLTMVTGAPAWAPASGGGSSPTGTGLALVSGGAFVGAAGPLNLAGGSTYLTGALPLANLTACSANQILVTVSGVQTCETVSGNGTLSAGTLSISDFTLPSQTAGATPWYNGSIWTTVAPGTSGQCYQSNGTSAPSWGSCGGGGGGYTSTTGDVISSGSGAVATTVEQLTGLSGTVTANAAIEWSAGFAGTQLSQATGTGTAFTIAPQANAGGTAGSFDVNLSAPGSGTTEAAFKLQRAGTTLISMGALTGGTTSAISWANGKTYLGDGPSGGYSELTLGGAEVAYSNGTNLTLGVGLSGSIVFEPTGALWGEVVPGGGGGWVLGYTASGPVPDFGGGQNVVEIPTVLTAPTAIPTTAGNVGFYGIPTGSNGYLGINAAGIQFPSFQGISNLVSVQIAAPATGNGKNLVLSGAPAGAGGTAGGTSIEPGDLTASVGVGSGTAGVQANTSVTIDALSAGATPIYIGPTTTGVIQLGNSSSPSSTLLNLQVPTATSASLGTFTPPATVAGWITVQVNGSTVKIPYYAP
jgi:hypothetical protein